MRPNSRPAGRLAVKRLRCTSAATSFYSVYVERLLKSEAEAFVRDPAALARSCHVVALAGAPAHALQERHADCSGRLVREDRLVLPSTLGGCCRRARQRTEHTSMLSTAACSSVYPAKSCPAADGAASAGRCAPGTHQLAEGLSALGALWCRWPSLHPLQARAARKGVPLAAAAHC